MFGCCVAGRLLQTNLQQVDDTHAFFELPAASSINHICVFLVGTVPFPDGYGAAIHFFWPGKGFQFLGMLSNDKPSTIFRLRGAFAPATTVQSAFSSAHSNIPPQADVTAILGIAIEPLSQIESQMQSLASTLAKPGADLSKDPTVLAERIIRHLFNYVSGFTEASTLNGDASVPMSVIARWYDTFLSKIRAGGVGFLEKAD